MIPGLVWLVFAWGFLILVLLQRWRERERQDAAQTEKVLDRLLHDHSHQYEQDAL